MLPPVSAQYVASCQALQTHAAEIYGAKFSNLICYSADDRFRAQSNFNDHAVSMTMIKRN